MTELSEYSTLSELSEYENSRIPHEVIEKDIAISPLGLQSDFTCPICLCLLTRTMTTRSCLHRFCYECITEALWSGNKECPTCRRKLVSKRDLRPDDNFDSLIKVLFPDKEMVDRRHEAILKTLNKLPKKEETCVETQPQTQKNNSLPKNKKKQPKRETTTKSESTDRMTRSKTKNSKK